MNISEFFSIVWTSIKYLNPPDILLIRTSNGLENSELCFSVLLA